MGVFLRAGSLCAPHSAIPTKNTAPLNKGASSLYTLEEIADLDTYMNKIDVLMLHKLRKTICLVKEQYLSSMMRHIV